MFRVKIGKENSRASGQNAAPTRANANALIRLVVGAVFLNEGVLKFLYPADQAAGRLANIGLPYPGFWRICGDGGNDLPGMIIIGFCVRPAAMVLFVDNSAAIFTTKIPVLLSQGYPGFRRMKPPFKRVGRAFTSAASSNQGRSVAPIK